MHPMFILGLGGLALLAITAGKTHEPVTPEKKSTGLIDPPNVPLEIAKRALKLSQVDGQAQMVWLNDNGWTRTAAALDKFYADELTSTEVLEIAKAEWTARLSGK